ARQCSEESDVLGLVNKQGEGIVTAAARCPGLPRSGFVQDPICRADRFRNSKKPAAASAPLFEETAKKGVPSAAHREVTYGKLLLPPSRETTHGRTSATVTTAHSSVRFRTGPDSRSRVAGALRPA